MALADDRQLHLADLVALGQVGVEVVLACEHVGHADLGVDGQAELDRVLHRLGVEYRQGTRHRQIDQAGLGVGLGTEGGGAAGEDLRSEEHTSELQSRENLVCRLLLEKKKITRLKTTSL